MSTTSSDYTPRPGKHIPALDGVRGIAILLVMVDHFTLYGPMRRPDTLIDMIFYGLALSGWCGVDLFFVLSGFLITGILFDAKDGRHFFRNFYIRRALRIFPLYYGFLFVFFVILPRLVPLGAQFELLRKEQGWYWGYLVNVSIAAQGWPPFAAIAHFWSLAVEEQFYLVWPLIVFLFGRRTLMRLCGICVIASLGLRIGLGLAGHPLASYVFAPARIDTLAVGSLLALVVRGPNSLSRLAKWAWPVAVATTTALSVMFLWRRGLRAENDIWVQTIGYTLFACLFGAILMAAVTASPETTRGKILSHPTLQTLGRYSYALYVFHHPIVFLLRDYLLPAGSFPRIMGSQLPGQLLFMLIATGITLALALLSWRFYEQPFLRLKTLFPYQQPTRASSPRIIPGSTNIS